MGRQRLLLQEEGRCAKTTRVPFNKIGSGSCRRETPLCDFAKHLNCHPEPAKTAKDLTDSDGGTHIKLCDPRAQERSLGALRLPRDDNIVNVVPN
jgi:hypothetical protein